MNTPRTIAVPASLLLILSSFLLAGCAKEAPSDQITQRPAAASVTPGIDPDALLGLDAREALALANRWGTATKEVQSYVDTEAVKVTFKSSGKTVEIPLPEDQMVVAFAPYVSKTHPCQIHYMSGCQGELVDTTVAVTAVLPDGAMLIDQQMETMKNGFLELWLPRNQEVAVTLEALGRRAEGTVGTFSGSNTCITTFQLM
jgi:hypothetical protein